MTLQDSLRRGRGLALGALLALASAGAGAAQTPRECALHPEFFYCQPIAAPSGPGALPPKPDQAVSDDDLQRRRLEFERRRQDLCQQPYVVVPPICVGR